MTFDEVLREPSELEILRSKVDRFIEEIAELAESGGTGTQEQICKFLLNLAGVIGLQD